MDEDIYHRFVELKEERYPIAKIGDEFFSAKDLFIQEIPIESVNTIDPDWDVLQKRLEMKKEDGTLQEVYTTNGLITPDEQIENVIDRTDEGFRYMLREHGQIRFIIEEYGSESI